ncbi:hypothetical protein GGR51DRAFT_564800 [Nemania sp. FL0031]|nr:hypothetical protein GGR51DRAFT_564800 [Nemania sp. FL0031]
MRYDSSSQRIYSYESLVTTSPRSFLYYIVAAVGPDKSHRPLAVAYRQGHCPDPDPKNRKCNEERVRQVMEDCMRLFDIFTEPSNRTALEAELSLAASWYQGPDYGAPNRAGVPDTQQPDLNYSWTETTREAPELPWQGGLREFPFISTCLRLALCRRGMRSGHLQEQSLSTIFRDDKLEYGMVVLDISDLDLIRYGIVGSAINYIAEVDVTRTGGWDAVEDNPPEKPAVPTIEERRGRKPLTSDQFLKKFRCTQMREATKALRRRPLIRLAALEYVWPANGSPSNHGQQTSAGPSNSRNKRKHADSLDQDIESLIQGLSHLEELDLSGIQQSTLHPEFQPRLLEALREAPLALSASRASVELLQLAYPGHSHLNWASHGNLTYESIAAAIQSNKLEDAKAFSLCIDRMSGSANALCDALLLSKSIREINFLQSPARESDELCSQLFAQHMFVRQQFASSRNPKTFRPCYFFLGDALLDPERFAVGFLEYCRSVLTDDDLLSFSCSPPTLSMYKKHHPGMRVSPIAAENFSIPRRCDVTSAHSGNIPDTQVECWPMMRDLEPGGWVVLVSHEWYISPEVDCSQPRPALGYETEVPFICYAFLRARKHFKINTKTSNSTPLLDAMIGPSSMEMVGGLAEFLRETETLDDPLLVNRLLEDTNDVLASRWPTRLGPGMVHLSTLDEIQARAILKDFIEYTPFLRENLRVAMEANSDEYQWYPELLERGRAPGLQRPARSLSVFKPLVAVGSEEVNPLGTEMKLYEESNYDDDL